MGCGFLFGREQPGWCMFGAHRVHRKVSTMAAKKASARRAHGRKRCTRLRIGKVSLYEHHGAWWLYYRDGGNQIRRRIGPDRAMAEKLASDINGQLAIDAPTPFAFAPIGIAELRTKYLQHHESVLRSSLATVNRYRAATQHLIDFVNSLGKLPKAHELSVTKFLIFLREREVSPNGHPNSVRRRLTDKGLRFVLEVCRSMYGFAGKQQHLPPYVANPFADLAIDRMRLTDRKNVFVFTQRTATEFLAKADDWEFAIHVTLALTGMRPGELGHLLIEELDLERGWLVIGNKPDLGWQVKTRNERRIPIIVELRELLRRLLGTRRAGLVFIRRQFGSRPTHRAGLDKAAMIQLMDERATTSVNKHDRTMQSKIAASVWRDVGLVDPDIIRTSFTRLAVSVGAGSCPKSWRHTFATMLQDANVDPLIRQITLGHQPQGGAGALGMTSVYTHTRPETQAREIERALRTWPDLIKLVANRVEGGATC